MGRRLISYVCSQEQRQAAVRLTFFSRSTKFQLRMPTTCVAQMIRRARLTLPDLGR